MNLASLHVAQQPRKLVMCGNARGLLVVKAARTPAEVITEALWRPSQSGAEEEKRCSAQLVDLLTPPHGQKADQLIGRGRWTRYGWKWLRAQHRADFNAARIRIQEVPKEAAWSHAMC